MKKICVIALSIFMSVSAFAGETWNNHVGFGWRLPTSTEMYAEKKGWDNVNFPVQTGLNLSYTGVLMSNGFTVHGVADFSFSSSNVDTPDGSEISNLIGFNTDLLIGAGWAPIRTDMFFFGFYGMIGYDISVVNYDAELFDSDSAKYINTVYYFAFLPALNATFVWTPVKSFSLFATASVGWNCPTFIFSEREDTNGKSSDKSISRGGLKVIPAVGISWKF